ncbi:Gas vesicle synthesis protein GvpL/GvpF [Halobacillus alkaliphilus]|uniref:Gas vesicle synthesis protein GvpL/GvpF n=1 Tax=Halobacillus alkaliphilus TaxID=396056 RepID=A0A1I2KQC1_9BACI|nr:GvpL/GvpF family gas vesicle protein [Halobacillus alkaliphilus]SFF67096.1 Gas vesicle synthesis protein GvpL/GvpF [Halobacillus alkaliphilus]
MSELIYLYGIVPVQEDRQSLSDLDGIDGEHALHTINFDNCAAVVCHVDEKDYGEKVLEDKTKDMEWVKDKAFHHHETLIKLRERTTIIPMKFCTIYQSENSLENMVSTHADDWVQLLENLKDKEEWNLKIYCDRPSLREKVAEHDLTIKEKKEEIEGMSKGKQYLQRKKLDQLVDEQVEKELNSFSKSFHDKLNTYCDQDLVKKTWNKDVTGKDEEMCWNAAFLLPLDQVEGFLEEVTTANSEHQHAGWKFEVTGPWPAYHFVNLSKSEV